LPEIGDSPLLCPPGEKAEREAANGVRQLDYLTDLVVGERAIKDVRETHVLDLQKLAVDGIYPCGGDYRDARTKIIISDSEHKPAGSRDTADGERNYKACLAYPISERCSHRIRRA
jgi:hypothetical protein